MKRKSATPIAEKILLLLLLGILILSSLAIRMNHIHWDANSNMEEETRNTMNIVDNIMYRDLFRSISAFLHPGFDYLTKKIFWYPILGVDERSIRLVSLLYGVAAILLNFFIILTLLQQNQKIPRLLLPITAFVGSIWIAVTWAHVSASVFGRLYSTITFVSALFTYSYFCKPMNKRFFYLTSLLLMNTHFFALPIIGTVYAYEAWKQKCLRPIFIFSALVALTFLVNYKPLVYLLSAYPSPGTRSLSESILVAFSLFSQFFISDISFGFSFATIFFLLALVDTVWNKVFRIEYFILGPLLFLFLVYLSKKSDYPVSPNYLFVFWGFIPVCFVAVFFTFTKFLQKSSELFLFKRPFISTFVCLVSLGAIAYLTGGISLVQAFSSLDKIKVPPRNFTRYYQGYTWAKQMADGRPLLVLIDACHTLEAPNFYIRYTHPIHRGALLMEDTFGCFYPRERVANNIQKFIQDNPNLLVLLDSRHQTCRGIQAENNEWNKNNNQKRNLLEPRFDTDVLCFQLMDKPKSYAEILTKLNASGFKHNLP